MIPEVIIGCSSFYNGQWKGIFYPEDVPSRQWFEYYASQFSTFEINSTFYKFPTVRSLKGWYQRTPADFIFSVKVPKEITHLKRLNDCESLFASFYEIVQEGLTDKLGCILFQFPPSFHYSEENLKLVVEAAGNGFNNAVELRHISWWRQETFEAFTKQGIIFCTPSYPKLPKEFIHTTKTGYIRLHGDPKIFYSEYTPEYLRSLHDEIAVSGVKRVFVYFNNTAGPGGIINAMQMKAIAAR